MFQSAFDAITQGTTLEASIRNLLTFWVEQGVCFTSGHVTSLIREADPARVFRQVTVGQIVRDMVADGSLPEYSEGPILGVMRFTARTDIRTPVGTGVYVYGPSAYEAEQFDFEISITEAPTILDGAGVPQTAAFTALHGGSGLTPQVLPNGQVAASQAVDTTAPILATIHADGRLCVPRRAFDSAHARFGTVVTGGDKFYARQEPDGRIFLTSSDPGNGAVEVTVTKDRLRAHVNVSTFSGHYPVGKPFPVAVESSTFIVG